MDNSSTKAFAVLEMFLLLIIVKYFILPNSFCSSFLYGLQMLLSLLLCVWRVCAKIKSLRAEVPVRKLCIDENVHEKLPREIEIMKQKPDAEKTYSHQNLKEQEVTIADVKTVMRMLGALYEPDDDKLKERLSSDDVVSLFEEQEPALQELKEAFGIFDENKDGFIDAKELRKILCTLCLGEALEVDCKRMIRVYDDNEDGLIDFTEFVRLVAQSFS